VVPSWLMCVMLLGYFPCNVYIDLNLCDTLGMDDTCSLLSFRRSVISLCSDEIYGYVVNRTTW
jgi:hypothetical protein